MDKKTFDRIRELVYEKSGISLSESKESLVRARIGKRMRVLGIENHAEYLKRIIADESGDEIVHLLDVISTNVTSFFREPKHFDFLKEAFSKWLAAGQKRFRLWCAACSSGEEPYTMAMVLREVASGYNGIDIKILATDISTQALAKCKEGRYEEKKVGTIPRPMLKPFPMRGPLDNVFCRNVMIYFDNTVRKRLLDSIYKLLKPGGYLMVGHAESLTGMVSDFKTVHPAIYTK